MPAAVSLASTIIPVTSGEGVTSPGCLVYEARAEVDWANEAAHTLPYHLGPRGHPRWREPRKSAFFWVAPPFPTSFAAARRSDKVRGARRTMRKRHPEPSDRCAASFPHAISVEILHNAALGLRGRWSDPSLPGRLPRAACACSFAPLASQTHALTFFIKTMQKSCRA